MTLLEILALLFKLTIFPGFVFLFVGSLLTEWYKRKIVARMENRMGPSYTGPAGILQPLADFFKLLTKEEIIPRGADAVALRAAPLLTSACFIFALYFIPVTGQALVDPPAGLLIVLLITAMASGTLYAMGWASANPYGAIGAVRVLSQVLGFDIPLFVLSLVPAMLTGSLSVTEISQRILPTLAEKPWLIPLWLASLALYLVAMQGEIEENPFNIPDAEQEIVAGYFTELSGRNLAFFDLARDSQFLFLCAIASTLYLGGPHPILDPYGVSAVALTLGKTLLVITLSMVIKATSARIRLDQAISNFWKVGVPLSLMVLAASALVGGV
ncbi:MAG: NADH-quinone oxidoreductase subunit H [Candidatus Korarchaeota archaeon]|nr:NADH-quinone oxidoreductase subunit H [Candidatus Korarchaeota archaeon]